MLAKLIYNIIKINIRNKYYNYLNILVELFSIILTLVIYWYTSKAFSLKISGNFAEYKTDYFHYLLIGEIFLSIPLILLTHFSKKTKMLLLDGTFETFLALPINILKPILLLTMTDLLWEMSHIFLTLVLAYLFFNFQIPYMNIIYCFAFFLFSIPVFVASGLFLSSLLLIFGRGENLIGYFTTITAILSGSFFPVDVFPSILVNLLNYLSPYTIYLQAVRHIASNGFENFNKINFMTMTIWNLTIICSIYFFYYAIKKYKDKGSLTIFTY